MGSSADFVVRYAVEVVLFVGAWCVLAIVVGVGYAQVCRWADRQRERDLRRILTCAGREARAELEEAYRRDMQVIQMSRHTDEAARAAVALDNAERDERAEVRLVEDLRRARLVVVPDVAELA